MPRRVTSPAAGELVRREALLARLLRRASRPPARGRAGTPCTPPRRAPREARYSCTALPGLGPEHALVERRRLVEQRVEPILAPALRVGLRRRLLVLELDVEAVGEPLDRADEVEPLGLAHERDRVAADAAAEAVVRAAVRRDRERRRLLLVEGAEPRVAAADLAQPRARLDEVDDVRRGLDGVDGRVLDPRHLERLGVLEGEAVGHAREIVHDLVRRVTPIGEVVEDLRARSRARARAPAPCADRGRRART